MIRFSPWGAYLLLVPQRGKVPIQNRLLIGDRALMLTKSRQHNQKQSFDVYLTEDQKDWKMDLLSLDPFLLG